MPVLEVSTESRLCVCVFVCLKRKSGMSASFGARNFEVTNRTPPSIKSGRAKEGQLSIKMFRGYENCAQSCWENKARKQGFAARRVTLCNIRQEGVWKIKLLVGDPSRVVVGRPGVDSHVRHDSEAAVVQIQFLVNEGALITATADDSIHLWNFRQKRPEVVHSLKFQRERITYIHLPLQSKWLYVGTEKGNIHVVNIESFVLSGYVINWNKAIEV
uniref:Uncharacterized protein n=1 Tax=Timema cristinae TaxID=61476 RepID=A0A7R9GTA7_TIMCR|nr:unnamed protein product [Timema cristinae]